MATFMIAASRSAGGGAVPAVKSASIRCSFQSKLSSTWVPRLRVDEFACASMLPPRAEQAPHIAAASNTTPENHHFSVTKQALRVLVFMRDLLDGPAGMRPVEGQCLSVLTWNKYEIHIGLYP